MRSWLAISHIPYQQVIGCLKAFEDKAIGRAFSTTPLEVSPDLVHSAYSLTLLTPESLSVVTG